MDLSDKKCISVLCAITSATISKQHRPTWWTWVTPWQGMPEGEGPGWRIQASIARCGEHVGIYEPSQIARAVPAKMPEATELLESGKCAKWRGQGLGGSNTGKDTRAELDSVRKWAEWFLFRLGGQWGKGHCDQLEGEGFHDAMGLQGVRGEFPPELPLILQESSLRICVKGYKVMAMGIPGLMP